MGGTTKTISGVPSDVQGLRSGVIGAIAGGGLKSPNMQPNYTQNPYFAPSTMTRRQAMNGAAVTNQGPLSATDMTPWGGSGPMFQGETASPVLQQLLNSGSPGSAQPANGATFSVPSDGGFSMVNSMANSTAPSTDTSSVWKGKNPGTIPPSAIGAYADTSTSSDPSKQWLYDSKTGQHLTPQEADRRRAAVSAGSNWDNSQQYSDVINQILQQPLQGPPPTTIAGLPGLDNATVADIGQMGHATVNTDPQFQAILDMIQKSAGQDLNAGSGGYGGPTITAPTIDSVSGMVKSADQIADPNSAFFQSLMKNYTGQADQNQALALAQAKEQTGNLTGSGYANAMGNVVNRSIADRNAKFSDLLQSLTSQEIGRQENVAGLEQNRNIANANNQLTASTASAQMAQQAQQLARQAVMSGRQDLMQIATALYNKAQTNAQLEQQDYASTYAQRGSAAAQNATMEQGANNDYFQAGVNRNTTQAQMDASRYATQYGGGMTQAGGNQNAILQAIMGLLSGGVGPDTVTQSGGIGNILPSILSLAGTIYGANKNAPATSGAK